MTTTPVSFIESTAGSWVDVDCLSDSISLIDRLSDEGCQTVSKAPDDDNNWLWDWANQPEYFCGNEWKIYAPKYSYLDQQRQLIERRPGIFSTKDVISLLFMTNVLSIVIGAGLTYGLISNHK